LNDAEKVEDSFSNSGILRYRNKKNIVEFLVHSERSSRRQFKAYESDDASSLRGTTLFMPANTSDSTKQLEREEKATVNYLPRYEWNTGYVGLWQSRFIPTLFYRHDLLLDHAYLESREIERIYVDDYVERVVRTSPRVDIQTARLLYNGRFCSSLRFLDQSVTGYAEPCLHLRSNVKSGCSGACHHKAFIKYGAEWALPERMLSNADYSYVHYIQPLIRWSYRPKFSQEHWHYIDKYDRLYPENRIDFIIQNNWQLEHLDIDFHVSQGFDFYNKADIFPLNRCYNQRHLSPFKIHAAFATQNADSTNFDLQILQEYSWKTFSLMQSEIVASLSWKKYHFFLGYLYQQEALQADRKLFSDIPMFAKVGCAIPLGNELQLHYHGSFYSKYPHAFPFFKATKPLLHNLRLNYDGHCWGLSIGYEEKRYRQYGKWKSERGITLALRLESIGSFAQKFRKTPTYRAPKGYE
jgi:hypothetical protein